MKHCPHCGAPPSACRFQIDPLWLTGAVVCSRCGARGPRVDAPKSPPDPSYDGAETACYMWDRRADSHSVSMRERLSELRAELTDNKYTHCIADDIQAILEEFPQVRADEPVSEKRVSFWRRFWGA